jgi:translation initiation factor 3 subunit G
LNFDSYRLFGIFRYVKAGDIQLLFSLNGKHNIRPFLVKHKEGDKEGLCKGFGYITFQDHKAAQEVIDKLDGHGYDQRVLNVDWAKPRDN